MHVSELLRAKPTDVFTISESADLSEAVRLLMEHNIGGLPVVGDEGTPIGFLAERDVIRAMEKTPDDLRGLGVRTVMRRPAPVCGTDDILQDVMSRMTRERLRHLVVIGDDRIQGVISVGDLVKHRLEQLETEAAVLRDYVAAQRARG